MVYFFFSGMNVHWDVVGSLAKFILQYLAGSMVKSSSRLAISEKKAFKNAADDCNASWLIANTGAKADGPAEDFLWLSFTSDLCYSQGFLHCFLSFGPVGLVYLDDKSCSWSLCKDVAWDSRSCKLAFFMDLPYALAHDLTDRNINVFH